jgi:uncharacterized membrane protein YwzB
LILLKQAQSLKQAQFWESCMHCSHSSLLVAAPKHEDLQRFVSFWQMSLVSHETFFKRPCDGHLAIIVVFTVVHLGSAVGAGLHQDCTWSNVVILVGV